MDSNRNIVLKKQFFLKVFVVDFDIFPWLRITDMIVTFLLEEWT